MKLNIYLWDFINRALFGAQLMGHQFMKNYLPEGNYPAGQGSAGIGTTALGTGTSTWPPGFQRSNNTPSSHLPQFSFYSSSACLFWPLTWYQPGFPWPPAASCGSSAPMLFMPVCGGLPCGYHKFPWLLQLVYNYSMAALTSISLTKFHSVWFWVLLREFTVFFGLHCYYTIKVSTKLGFLTEEIFC